MEISIFNTQVSSSNTITDEESSWTAYFEDFLVNKTELSSAAGSYDRTDHVSGCDSSSSSITNKLKDDEEKFMGRLSLKKGCPSSCFKKRKNREKPVDEAFEDTASSPVNSPKISDLRQLKKNPLTSQEKAGSVDDEKEGNLCTESSLKKKGLCLVPLSVIVNYFG